MALAVPQRSTKSVWCHFLESWTPEYWISSYASTCRPDRVTMSSCYDLKQVHVPFLPLLTSSLDTLPRTCAQKWPAQRCVPINEPDRQRRKALVDHARQPQPCMRKLESQKHRVKSREQPATSPRKSKDRNDRKTSCGRVFDDDDEL